MALIPGKKGSYHISGVKRGSSVVNGVEVFRGHGSDASDNGNDFIYISSEALGRTVTFKAFISSMKINLSTEHEVKTEADKQSSTFNIYSGDVVIDVSLDIPAHSTNEAVNNIAKIEELQRLIAPINNGEIVGKRYGSYSSGNLFKVWFKNLISMADGFKTFPTPENISFEDIDAHGFPCVLEKINYEPDLEAGFFEFDNFLYPKNIKLNLNLALDGVTDLNKNLKFPIVGFKATGHYGDDDAGFFPFNIPLKDGRFIESDNVEPILETYNTKTVNVLDNRLHGNKNNTYLFVSLPIDKSNEEQISRWVVFKGFFDSFNREYAVNLQYNKSRNINVGKSLNTESVASHKELIYNMKLTLPAFSLEEAKKNCAKVQYLARMFFRPDSSDSVIDVITEMLDNPPVGPDIFTPGRTEYASNINREVRFYSPSFIETPDATRSFVSPDNFSLMFNNSIPMYFLELSMDFNLETGFFVDNNDMLFPKEISVQIKTLYADNNLIKNYLIDNTLGESEIGHSLIIDNYKAEKEYLFPYNRKTVKIGGI